MNVFDEINSLSAETVLSQLNLPMAKDGKSYICPLCGNGTGKDGDGIRPRISRGRVRWKCHKCGVDFSNVDLAAATLGLNVENETGEAIRQVKKLFGVYDESDNNFSFSRGKSARSAWTPELKEALSFENKGAVEVDEKKESAVAVAEPKTEPTKNYSKFYEWCRANVGKFLAERGGSFRGLTAETFKKYGLGVHPNFGVEGHEKSPHLIIPYDDSHYLARAIVGHDRSQHGANSGLYETLPINTEFANFICEGEIDALSIAQVIPTWKIGCFATGGASKWHKVVPELEKRFANAEQKPCFFVVFDNDETGKLNGRKLALALKAAGYPAKFFPFDKVIPDSDNTKEKIDANALLQKNPDELWKKLADIIDYDSELYKQRELFRKSAEQKKITAQDKSGIKFSFFKEYFGADFFSDITATAKYSDRKTGFKNLDAAQVFLPGLYVLGALPATGKTTFAWQLLNQLADKGEPCIYCSYEMSRAELLTKSIVRELYKWNPELSERLKLSSVNIRRGACSGLKELHEQAARFAESSTNLTVAELSNTGVAELIEALKPLVADVLKSPVICLDYLQIVPSKSVKTSTAKEKIDDVVLRLKDFQRETNSTIIVISSFNRDNYWQRVNFSSFKESGAIEYSADSIWALENFVADDVEENSKDFKKEITEMSKQKIRKVWFKCLKNRNGGQYDCLFRYHAAFDYFEPLEEEKERRPKHER